MRDILAMLKDSGSRKITERNHYKYELPNGNIFVCPKTPSDYRGVRNCLNALRKELRETHPAIADRGRTIRKKAVLNTTIGDLLKAKEGGKVSPFSAIPGSEPVPEKEMEFEITNKPVEVVAEAPEPILHEIPRKPRAEPNPKPSSYRSLTSEQMEEANRILHSEGDAAMNVYINQCRTEERPVERKRHIKVEKADPMTELMERARLELDRVGKRIAGYDLQIADLKAQQENDVLKQAQIEQYIARHEALAKEAAELIEMLPEPAAPTKGKVRRGPRDPNKAKGYGVREIRATVFPLLGPEEFNSRHIVSLAKEAGLPEPHYAPSQINWMLIMEAKREGSLIENLGEGNFRLKPSMTFLPPAIPITKVAHA
jgi:hypothetical protein